MKYIKSLNWSGYLFCLVLCALGSCLNESVVSFKTWLVPFTIGAVLCLFFLFAGRKEIK